MAGAGDYILADLKGTGLPIVFFVPMVLVILFFNIAVVTGYKKFIAKNPDKVVAVKLKPGIVTKLRYV